MTPNEFKAKWSKTSGNERQTYQEHFRDLCTMLHQPTPSAADRADLKKRTLTNLYNERPTWLQHLHQRLDRAVWSAYNWPDNPTETTDEQILERLLALNTERSR